MKIVIMGNSAAGKTTMARRLSEQKDLPLLSLDLIALDKLNNLLPLPDHVRIAALNRFLDTHDRWIVEGAFGDLLEIAVAQCTELRWLNPDVEVCVEHCRRRPWDPQLYSTPGYQWARLDWQIGWIREYPDRDDKVSLSCHRKLFDAFRGPKREYRSVTSYDED